MRQVISELETIRRRSRTMLLIQRVSVVVAWVIGLTVCLVALDFLLRLFTKQPRRPTTLGIGTTPKTPEFSRIRLQKLFTALGWWV